VSYVTSDHVALYKDELHDPYSSSNIILVMKVRRMIWAKHVARMGRKEVHTGFWWGSLWEGDHLEDLGVGGRITLKWVFRSGIDLAQDRDSWRSLLSGVMNLRVP
jgi:hypothetical protein